MSSSVSQSDDLDPNSENTFQDGNNERYCLRPLDNKISQFFILDDDEKNSFKLGKSRTEADFVIDDEGLAGVHAWFTMIGDSWVISRERTLGSGRWIRVNGTPLSKPLALVKDDEIAVGTDEGAYFRLSFERYQGQQDRKYTDNCPNAKCRSRLDREFLCEECMDRENESYENAYLLGQNNDSNYGLSPLDEITNHGKPIIIPNCGRYTIVFESDKEWKYSSVVVNFVRGNNSIYARCDNYKLHPQSFCIGSQHPEDMFGLLKEGDRIQISYSEDQDDVEWYEAVVLRSHACLDCQEKGLCDNCKPNKLGKLPTEVDEMEDPRYLVSLNDGKNCKFIRLVGTRMVIGNGSPDEIDHLLGFDTPEEGRVEFLSGRGGLWFASVSKDESETFFYVNGNETNPFHLLNDGDVLQFGASSSRKVCLFRYTAVSTKSSFRLDNRVEISSSEDRSLETTNTRDDRRNCFEETRFAKLNIENCCETIYLHYVESKFFKRSLVVDNHAIKDVHDKIRVENERNELFLNSIKINNSNSKDFSQNVEAADHQSDYNHLDFKISNSECHNYLQNIVLSSTANKNKSGYLSIIGVKCSSFSHQVKLAPYGDENFLTSVQIRNFSCSNVHGEILVKSPNIKNFVHFIYIQNNWSENIQQNIVIVNENVVNGLVKIWLVNDYNRQCFQNIVIDNVKSNKLHIDIYLNHEGSEEYRFVLRVQNKECQNITYTIKHFHSVVEYESYESDLVRMTISDLNSLGSARVRYVKVNKTLGQILNYCSRLGVNLGWYLTRLQTSDGDAQKSETFSVQIRRSAPAVIASRSQGESELMAYIRENHPNIILQNYGVLNGCMFAAAPVHVRAIKKTFKKK